MLPIGKIKTLGESDRFRGIQTILEESIEQNNSIGQYAFQDNSTNMHINGKRMKSAIHWQNKNCM